MRFSPSAPCMRRSPRTMRMRLQSISAMASDARLLDLGAALLPPMLRSRYSGVSHTPLLGNRPGTFALGDALASDATLQLRQLGLATHVHPALAGSSSAV